MRVGRGRTAVVGAMAVLCLLLAGGPLLAHAAPATAEPAKVVPTTICVCAPQPAGQGSGVPGFRGHGPPNSTPLYDEQLGVTFTQSFTSLEYNVTAVEQTDPTLADGPAYLLNGLSNLGYWYQVGVSWNWNPGTNPGTGFDMNFEVFNGAGNSVFPTNGNGGIDAFSGTVNEGDPVTLNLYISTTNQQVVMIAEDTVTGAMASEVYPDMGATSFIGLPSSVANQNGFFTGLMTEWYHGDPYYANEAEVTFSNPSLAVSSGWMWMDEFNPNTEGAIFSTNTSTPISYADPNTLQEFSYNGTTEYSDAYEFVTGALNSTAPPPPPPPSVVPLTLSFSVQGGGTGYSAPVLSYVSDGKTSTVFLTQTPTAYNVDAGTTWTVSQSLAGGSNGEERFETDQPSSGTASGTLTVQFIYYTQFNVVFGYSVTGGGTGAGAPTASFTSFGSSSTTPAGTDVWADSGSPYQYQQLLPGSTSSERWFTNSSGTVTSSHSIGATYFHQYLVSVDLSFVAIQNPPGVVLTSTSEGQPLDVTLVQGANQEWLDEGAAYSLPQTFSLSPGERLEAVNATVSGTVSTPVTIHLPYMHQFFIGVSQNVPNGGTVSASSGWYDAGSTLSVNATASTGYQFEVWNGTESGAVSSANPSLTLTAGSGGPANETAEFDVGVTIAANGPDGLSYSDGSVSGAVAPGKSAEVFVPPASNLTLTSTGTGLFSSFSGWTGATTSSSRQISLMLNGPETITSNSSSDLYTVLLLVVIAAIAAAAAVALSMRKRPSPPAP
ncbi:MAG: hypothetical protein OK456_04835 [Thaumarchaeota archaeon]|nr:hypothetical protein [Nitrososphaerota archaeon]